jgi:hypothetical protein
MRAEGDNRQADADHQDLRLPLRGFELGRRLSLAALGRPRDAVGKRRHLLRVLIDQGHLRVDIVHLRHVFAEHRGIGFDAVAQIDLAGLRVEELVERLVEIIDLGEVVLARCIFTPQLILRLEPPHRQHRHR